MGKLIVAIGILVIGIVTLIYVVNPYQIYKETSFKSFYENLSSSIKKLDCAAIYSAKSDSFKAKVRFDYYVLSCEGAKTSLSENINVHRIWVTGNTGYADRTRISCFSTNCAGEKRIEKRETKKYLFIGGRWTIQDSDDPLDLTSKQ